ncbi:hypothetical protein NDR87_33590 [Nocardia sp. CDC159]|uniref:Uncharacterized protein n=1 Tax=Nocardia pulmonis TaxID=2951408 RepID=A0A9X2EDP5_9NOCA|nr:MULTISPECIES: hypothetical protein [Nocardia]MCM6778430.1 hypothetical protein [Nocardia pulmonis]MCM6791319.1 hypothetical protein [Nocardia sp. CDC159]
MAANGFAVDVYCISVGSGPTTFTAASILVFSPSVTPVSTALRQVSMVLQSTLETLSAYWDATSSALARASAHANDAMYSHRRVGTNTAEALQAFGGARRQSCEYRCLATRSVMSRIGGIVEDKGPREEFDEPGNECA